MIIKQILCQKWRDVRSLKKTKPLPVLYREIEKQDPARNFKEAIQSNGNISVIAEIKKASPSAGLFTEFLDPQEIARNYVAAGAAALSVVTEEHFFQGSPAFLKLARESAGVPVLRKDFIIDSYQIYESRVIGADAVLLISSFLAKKELAEFIKISSSLGMASLVEVCSFADLKKAVSAGAEIIGINNRDLRDFSIDLQRTVSLGRFVPRDILLVSESGIRAKEDIYQVAKIGVDAVLVGEVLMRSPDGGREKLRELVNHHVTYSP